MTDAPPWWTTLDDQPAVALARRLATVFHGLSPDDMVLPYEPQVLYPPSGAVALVRSSDLRPLWTCYMGAARAAIEAQAALAVEAELGPERDVIAVPKTPDQVWREERGLDGE